MRVYLPATLSSLAELRDRGRFAAADAYLARVGAEDLEEAEYAAFTQAAQASLALLRADPDAPRRRVVVSADLPGEPTSGDLVPLATVAAVHVDTADAEPDVAAAVASGTEVDYELAWYDVSELDQLLV
jgi:hypothetical protein